MNIQHRNAGTIPSVVLACIIGMVSCGQSGSSSPSDANQAAAQVLHGPAVDRIIVIARTDQAQAIADVAAGEADLILNPLPPSAFSTVDIADLAKLQLYSVPAESWSILLNPIPDTAPYTWTTASGQTSFNPLAIQEVRYALNWLFDRQRMVNEILDGRGTAGFTPLPPGLASTTRYDEVPAGLGMSAAGDENKAIEEITSAMDAAARLPENDGRLLKATDGFWQYDGKPVSIKLLVRADEPAGRLPAGRYLAEQLEKAGFKVQRLERDRSALATAYYSNPADLAFHIYIEAWAPRTDGFSWNLIIGQQYAPHYGNLPGGADQAWWQYRNPELDKLAIKAAGGQSREEDRLTDSLKALELGLREAVRIYLAFQHDTFATNKARFESPLIPDPVAGLNGVSLRTARVQARTTPTRDGDVDVDGDGDGDGDGSRILRVLLVQSGQDKALIPGSWDPASPEGFTDGYSRTIAELISETAQVSAAVPGSETRSSDNPGMPFRWHNGIEMGADDATYAATHGAGWSTKVLLPWDMYEVLGQLSKENAGKDLQPGLQPGLHSGLDLVSPGNIDTILAKYRELLEQQWVPPELEGLVDPEQAARRYQASRDFIEDHGHGLISNGPFMLASLDNDTGTALLEAFQDYPYGSEYPVRSTGD